MPGSRQNRPFKYSEHPKTGSSGIQMVIFRTLFKSGFRLVKGNHLVFYHSKTGLFCPVFEWWTSLYRFIKKRVIKNILFMPKRSRLAIQQPDKNRIRKLTTVRYSDVHCTGLVQCWDKNCILAASFQGNGNAMKAWCNEWKVLVFKFASMNYKVKVKIKNRTFKPRKNDYRYSNGSHFLFPDL
jgi:hypothetical protein